MDGDEQWYENRNVTPAQVAELANKIINHGSLQFIVAGGGHDGKIGQIRLIEHPSDVKILSPERGAESFQVYEYGPSLSDLLARGWVKEKPQPKPG